MTTKHLGLSALCLTACMSLAACNFGTDTSVTDRDLEVARQMEAPKDVIKSMEAGEWRQDGDRDAIRYAELAIDHMQDEYKQKCHAKWMEDPWWVPPTKVGVTLSADGGEHGGAQVLVTVTKSEPKEFSDNWKAILNAPKYRKIVTESLEKAFDGLPREAWVAEPWASKNLMGSDDKAGTVNIYVSPSAIPDKEKLDEVKQSIEERLKKSGTKTSYYLVVTKEEPPDGVMTTEHGRKALKDGDEAISLRANGNIGR